jgi:hypothetical protein
MAAHKGWRIKVLTHRTGNTYWNVSEVNFFGADGERKRTGGAAYGSPNFSGGTYDSSKAFDENPGTTFSGDKASAQTLGVPDFLAYIYAAPVEIVACWLYGYGDGTEPATYALEYSDDSTNGADGVWTEAARKDNPARSAVLPIFTADLPAFPPAGAHTCWRMYSVNIASDTGGIGNPSLGELQFRSDIDVSEPAVGGTPIGGGYYGGGYEYANAFDGNQNSAWVAPNTSGPAWVGYQYPAAKSVNQVMMRSRNAYADTCSPRLFFIQYADDPAGPWSTAWIGSAAVQWADAELRTFTNPALGAPLERRRRLGGFLG